MNRIYLRIESPVFRRFVLVTAIIASLAFATEGALAQKGNGGGGKGGNGGGDSGGGETIANPAFVFEKSGDGNLHLLTYDGSQQLALTNPGSGENDVNPTWSPDGSMIAFNRSRSGGRDLYIVTVPEDTNGDVDVAQAEESLVVPLAFGRGAMSWTITNEIVFADPTLVVVDLDAANPVKQPLMDIGTFDMIPAFATGGKSIKLGYTTAVDVQPVAQNDTLLVAFVADWENTVDHVLGSDLFVVEADISSGKLDVDSSTIQNVSNPTFLPESQTNSKVKSYLSWSSDGAEVAYIERRFDTNDDPLGGSAVVSYDFVNGTYTDLVVSDPDDDDDAPSDSVSFSPDGLELALTVSTALRNNTTYDVCVAPAILPGIGIRDPLVINVTNTLRANKREGAADWRPTWTR